MARTAGSRNRDYEHKRGQLLEALNRRLREPDGARLSVSEMAEAAGVSVSSLRHHLGTRSEILASVMAEQGKLGAPYLARVREEPSLPVEASLRDPLAGVSFLENLLEPILQSLECRLEAHARSSELIRADYRIAALGLVSPLVLATLHQNALCGTTVRPLSLPALVEEQVAVFLRAYGSSPPARRSG